MDKKNVSSFEEGAHFIMDILGQRYQKHMFDIVEKFPELLETYPGFLLNPEKIHIYIGNTHLAIEFDGPERIANLPSGTLNVQISYYDYTQITDNFFKEIIGFEYDSNGIIFPLSDINQNVKYPTNKGMDKLIDLKRNFLGEDLCMVIGNAGYPTEDKGKFSMLVNCFFYDEEGGSLKTRHIKRLDLIPLDYDDSDTKIDKIGFELPYNKTMAINDIGYNYPLPEEYKQIKLRLLNRFTEFYGDHSKTETEITSFLSKKENNFIITMNFGSKNLFSEKICKRQSETRDDIKPDFFIENQNGYCDILEFKLPNLKGNAIVGKPNRETFSAEINSYISQTRVYEQYFEDPNNRKRVEEEYGIKIYKPRRIVVMGNRHDFTTDERINIKDDYKNITILTYDDIKDGAVSQLYQ